MTRFFLPLVLLLVLVALSCSEPPNGRSGAFSIDVPDVARIVPGNRPPMTQYERIHTLRKFFQSRLPGGQIQARAADPGRAQSWTNLTTTGAPTARTGHHMVWASNTNQLLVYGGFTGTAYVATDGKWNASNSTWLAMSGTAPNAREGASAVWTSGNRFVVWGGTNSNTLATTRNNGNRYDASGDTWALMTNTNRPLGRAFAMAAPDGSNRMFQFGGLTNATAFANTMGHLYSATANSWTAVNTTGAPTSRIGATAVWTGTEIIIWGGYDSTNAYVNTGARFNPTTNVWTTMNTTNAPAARAEMVAEWTGSRLFVWGGLTRASNNFTFFDDGGQYDPTGDTWTAVSNALTNTPTARYEAASSVGGNYIVVWGGTSFDASDQNSYSNTGALYDYTTNTWTSIVATNVSARGSHTMVRQSSTQVLLWGGQDGSGTMNTGAQFTFP